jgi:hypothetical protein
MAVDEKISQLPEALTLAEDDYVPIVQASSGLNKKAKVSAFVPDASFIENIVVKNQTNATLEIDKINWVTLINDHTMSVPTPDASNLGKIIIVNNRSSSYSLSITGVVVMPMVLTGYNSIVGFVCVTDGVNYGWEVFSRYNVGDFNLVSQTITNGVTDKAPSQNAVFDVLTAAANTTAYNQSTGVYKGGVLSIGTPNTTFSISDGNGAVADNSTGTNIYTFVSWTGKTNITATYVASGLVSYVAIDIAGNVVQQLAPFTQTQSRSLILLGSLIHTNLTNLDAVNNFQDVILSPANMLHDISHSLGVFNISGNLFSANGANLNLNKTIGYVYSVGSNWANDPLNPSQVTLASLTALTFQYRFQTGTNGATGIAINPNIYDVAGVSTAVPSSKYTIQRIYSFVSNNVKIQPGQAFYQTLAEAKASIQTEQFTTESSIAQNGLLRGFLVIKQGTTSLTNTADCFFYEASKFGGQQGIGGQSVSSLQNAYDNSLTPEILTDTTRGALSIKRGSAADTDTIYEGQNGAGTTTWSVDGNGLIYSGQATASTPSFFDSAKKLISTTAQLWGTWVQTWASKATPVDADTIGFYNSASTFVGVKSTLLNLWTTYFKVKADLLYVKLSGLTTNKLLTFDGTNVVSIAGIQLSATWGQLFGYQGTVGSNGSIFSVLNTAGSTELLTIKNDGTGVTMNSTRHEFGTLNQVGSIVFDKNLYFSSQVWVRAVDASASNYMHSWINSALGIYGFRYTNTLEARWQSVNTTANTVLQKWSNSAGTQIGVLQNDGLYFGTGTKSTRAILQADSTTQGFLPPRMTSIQKEAIVDTEGLVVYDTDLNALCTNDGVSWTTLGFGAGTTTSSATPTIDTDSINYYELTAQAVDITSFTTNLTGTPKRGQKLWIDITGTAARAITWGASFESSTIALPTTTVTTDKLSVEFIWNVATSKWRCVRTA